MRWSPRRANPAARRRRRRSARLSSRAPPQAARRGGGGAPFRRRPRRPRRPADPAGACLRRLGALGPLHRFDPRLPGRVGGVDDGSSTRSTALAVGGTRPNLTIILDCAGRDRPGAGRGAPGGSGDGAGPLRGRGARPCTRGGGRPISRSPRREPERCVVVDADPPEDAGRRGHLADGVDTASSSSDGVSHGGSDREAIPRLDTIGGWPAPEERADWFGDPAAERDAPRRLSQRPHAPCLADRRPARHRQGDARLPLRPLRPRPSRSRVRPRCRRPPISRSRPIIRRSAASPRRAHPNLLAARAAVGRRRTSATGPS